MNTSSLRCFVLIVLVPLLSGCTSKSADFCRLLTMKEVGAVHAGVVVAKMEEWYKSTDHPTWYCSWKDSQERNLFSLSASFATSNPPSAILRTFSTRNDRIVEIPGVDNDAAGLLYTNSDGEHRLTFMARNSKWTLDIRSPISGDENGEQFRQIADLANTAFARLDTDKVFSKLKK